MAHYEWSHKSIPSAESDAYEFLEQALEENSIRSTLREKIWLVMAEAITNALTHGNGFSPDKVVKIALDINDQTFTADIIDQGQGGAERIKNRKSPQPLSESGRGVDLICYYCARATFGEMPDGGMRVTIVFEREIEKITQK